MTVIFFRYDVFYMDLLICSKVRPALFLLAEVGLVFTTLKQSQEVQSSCYEQKGSQDSSEQS